MSTMLECPLCERVTKIDSEDPDCGLSFKWSDLEKIFMADHDIDGSQIVTEASGDIASAIRGAAHAVGDAVSDRVHELGRDTFWCCGRMVWMEGSGWMVSLDYIAGLARAVRDMAPTDLENLLLSLTVVMPNEIHRVRALLNANTKGQT